MPAALSLEQESPVLHVSPSSYSGFAWMSDMLLLHFMSSDQARPVLW